MDSTLQNTFPFPIYAHSFNLDRTEVAVSLNTNQIFIYKLETRGEWKLIHTLQEHDLQVTSIDWAPNTNVIVSCSQDKNAYVWNYDNSLNKWKPSIVHLRINRAATFVRWSPLENKFAVASGARQISVCYFSKDSDWWVSKHLKKPITSTILSLDWHPNNVLLATGSADMKARVFSAFIKGVDEKPAPTAWGEKLPFNTVCGEYENPTGGWIHSVAFSPSGSLLAFTGHDCSLNIVDSETNSLQNLRCNTLPFTCIKFLAENKLVAAGHDYVPSLFESDSQGSWKFVKTLDMGVQKKAASSGLAANAAFNKFRQMDSLGKQENTPEEAQLSTTHHNTIKDLREFKSNGTEITSFSTSGLDGKVVIWNI